MLLLLVGGLLAAQPAPTLPLERHEFSEPHMGTTFRIVLYAASAEQAARAAAEAFARVGALDAALSDYRPDSELTALSRRSGGPPVPVGPDLFHVLSLAQEWARRSGGAFDVTAGPVVQAWRRARRILERPDPSALAAARALVGHDKLALDAAARTARLAAAGMKLDLGGIAKGFAADEAQAVLRAHSVTRALVAAGGDIVVSGPPPGREGWSVGIALPAPLAGPQAAPLELSDAAVSTSGDAEQWVTLDGVRYSHVVDPRTGMALTGPAAATVVAPTGAASDALATALLVLGLEEGLALVDATPGAAAWIARESPVGVERVFSRRWPAAHSNHAHGAARSTAAGARGGLGGSAKAGVIADAARYAPRGPSSSDPRRGEPDAGRQRKRSAARAGRCRTPAAGPRDPPRDQAPAATREARRRRRRGGSGGSAKAIAVSVAGGLRDPPRDKEAHHAATGVH